MKDCELRLRDLLERTSPAIQTLSPLLPIVELWMLRALVPLGGHHKFIGTRGFNSEEVARALGLRCDDEDDEANGYTERKAMAELRELHRRAEVVHAQARVPECLERNCERMAELVGLNEVERRILELAVLLHTDNRLSNACGRLEDLNSQRTPEVLAVLLNLPATPIRDALQPSAVLARSGLVTMDRHSSGNLRHKLDLLSSQFGDLMSYSDADPVSLLRGTVSPAPAADLCVDDYAHVRPTLDILLPYLTRAKREARSGVNILVHGRPGVGKTQLARMLGAQIGSEVFEVANEDTDGDPINGDKRLRAFRAAQSFFANRQALILFDEVEDIFGNGDEGFANSKSTAQERKAWINRMLETGAVPAVWLSNSIRGIDQAFIRRFDLVFELPVPKKDQRARIIRTTCGEMTLRDSTVDRIAAVDTLAPAIVTRAAKVARAVHGDAPGDADETLERLINHTLQALGQSELAQVHAHRLPETYDPAFIHTDIDLRGLVEGLRSRAEGRLCMYGPPGTGKTAYARWLAEQLGRPLIVKRASDLISPYVGENEQNIAAAFAQARDEGAVLLIDEVDTFLRSRDHALRNWEVSMVNEMLTQMETFTGVFIASTNRMDDLDEAVLRRFDCKAKFDYLRTEQALELLRRTCRQLGLPEPDAAQERALGELAALTPGDFALVVRQSRLRRLTHAGELIEALRVECRLKRSATRNPMGFVQ